MSLSCWWKWLSRQLLNSKFNVMLLPAENISHFCMKYKVNSEVEKSIQLLDMPTKQGNHKKCMQVTVLFPNFTA